MELCVASLKANELSWESALHIKDDEDTRVREYEENRRFQNVRKSVPEKCFVRFLLTQTRTRNVTRQLIIDARCL